VGRKDQPEPILHGTHHSGTVRSITVTDHAVEVELDTRAGLPSMTITFSHSFDPLLTESAAELTVGMPAAIAVLAWRDDSGDVRRYDGRGLTT
jgi:hypothetical protein